MLKGKDLYWIYEMRPLVERTEDEFYKKMADGYANYLNEIASFMSYDISFEENEKVFSIYSDNIISPSSNIAAIAPLHCEDGTYIWYFEMKTQMLELDVIHLADYLYNAIKNMEKQRP